MTPAPLALADCEHVRGGLVGQPANAASCLAYLGAGAALVARARRRPLCRPDSLLQGHAAWHVLTAAMLWWWGREALGGQLVMPPRPTRPRASSTSPM